ncbi:tyrosine-type recombinase/integrase [bacterium]|nr:tyrosine-type recombinase/integrase [bacterium]
MFEELIAMCSTKGTEQSGTLRSSTWQRDGKPAEKVLRPQFMSEQECRLIYGITPSNARLLDQMMVLNGGNSLDDFSRLLASTAEGNPFRGLTGQDRVVLYLTAVSTGFRASELASLTISSFDLDAETPTITVQAAYSKRRRTDTRPLRAELAAMFRDYFDALADTRQGDLIPIRSKRLVWPGTWPQKASVMVRTDQEAADVSYRDEHDRVLDFHGLRHTFGTNLAKAGISPKVAQELMRHSDGNLTLNTYSHVGLHDLAGAVEQLPPVPYAVPEVATGTSPDAVFAFKPEETGNYQELSAVTGDQMARRAPDAEEQQGGSSHSRHDPFVASGRDPQQSEP